MVLFVVFFGVLFVGLFGIFGVLFTSLILYHNIVDYCYMALFDLNKLKMNSLRSFRYSEHLSLSRPSRDLMMVLVTSDSDQNTKPREGMNRNVLKIQISMRNMIC